MREGGGGHYISKSVKCLPLKLMPNTVLTLLIMLFLIALHGRKSHYKNAEEENNTRLKSPVLIEAMFCDSIKRVLWPG